jgi:D-arabinose 1-dehydrogenase-like Zn-dependent alcohol dehydrogenase
MDEPNPSSRPRVLRWIEWGAVVLLVGGVSAYLLWKPLDPMADPRAAHALALVQIHPARSAPSIRQALDAVLQENRKPGRSPSVGPTVTIDLRFLYMRQTTVMGSMMGARAELLAASKWIGEGRIQAIIDSVLPLKEVRSAHERMLDRMLFGKIVLTP